jgi:hypothetical protein
MTNDRIVLYLYYRCAHDRVHFARGGWGRLSIGMYVLFYVKWLEHFPPSHFLLVRLEDYDAAPQEYMERVFSFLDLAPPHDWEQVIGKRHSNQARINREPMLEETETALREFYRPYNEMLASFTENSLFLWPLPKDEKTGQVITLRQQQLSEFASAKKTNLRAPILQLTSPKPKPIIGSHPERKPRAFSTEGLPVVIPGVFLHGQNFSGTDFYSVLSKHQDVESALVDEKSAALQLCVSVFGLDLPAVIYMLYEVGLPADLRVPDSHSQTAWHCLANLHTMADSHSRSQVFALLKGRETWLTPFFRSSPLLPVLSHSVLSSDIVALLEEPIDIMAQWLLRAKVPVDAVDALGNTALHYAAIGGHLGLARLLLDAGVDPNIRNHEKRTALHYAAGRGNAQMLGVLAKAGGDMAISDKFHVAPIDIAINPGPIPAADALTFLGVQQRAARQIDRILHPEFHPEDPLRGWVGGDGGWGTERLKGYETDLNCSVIDQYWAHEITAEEVFYKYMARNAPVLIRGLLNDWEVFLKLLWLFCNCR